MSRDSYTSDISLASSHHLFGPPWKGTGSALLLRELSHQYVPELTLWSTTHCTGVGTVYTLVGCSYFPFCLNRLPGHRNRLKFNIFALKRRQLIQLFVLVYKLFHLQKMGSKFLLPGAVKALGSWLSSHNFCLPFLPSLITYLAFKTPWYGLFFPLYLVNKNLQQAQFQILPKTQLQPKRSCCL